MTSWLAEGEGLVEVATAYRELGKALGRDTGAAVKFIRQNQRSGKLGPMTLPEAMQRLVQLAGVALTSQRRSLDNLLKKQNTKRAIAFCLANPRWRLSLQTHKVLGIS